MCSLLPKYEQFNNPDVQLHCLCIYNLLQASSNLLEPYCLMRKQQYLMIF